MKQIHYYLLLVCSSIFLFSCEGGKKINSDYSLPVERFSDSRNGEPDPIRQSLFDSKERTISEENIQKLLNGNLVIPDTVRIAVYQYSRSPLNRYYYSYSSDEDYLKAQQSFVDTLIGHIARSGRVKKIALIPSMMIVQQPTITNMRETAVRLQADLLLVFSITSDIYYKYRMFQKDEAKAFATTECLLMDVRTALVPYSSIVTKDFFAKKAEADTNLEELRKRAEKAAILETLSESGNKLIKFMQNRD